jgi:uncharacterized membrane protein
LELLRGVTLAAAIIATGVMAGVFQLYTHTIMRGLRGVDDRTFIAAFQALDRAIINPLFMLHFLGAPVFIVLALVLNLGADSRSKVLWLAAALVLYLATMVITFRVNVPRNDALKAAGDPDDLSDPAGVRRQFDEALWTRWNSVRAVLCVGSLICLVVAAVA